MLLNLNFCIPIQLIINSTAINNEKYTPEYHMGITGSLKYCVKCIHVMLFAIGIVHIKFVRTAHKAAPADIKVPFTTKPKGFI